MSVAMLGGCSQSASTQSSTPSAKVSAAPASTPAAKKIVIGVTFDYVSDFMAYVNGGAVDYGKKHPEVQVIISDANKDVSAQLKAAENFIAQKVSAIVIKPQDKDACKPISDACKAAGIPLVCSASAISAPYDAYVGADNKKAGLMQGEWMAKYLNGKGNIAIIQGDPTISNGRDRTEGNKEIFAKNPGIKIVDEQIGKWMRDQAMSIAENWLQSKRPIDAIVSNNDEMAIGSALAFKDAGKKIPIIGVGGTKSGLTAVKNGDMAMTIFQSGYEMGYGAVDVAVKLAQGQKVEKFIATEDAVVTKDNVDEYLKKIQ